MNQKKAIYDDYAKLILADPQVLANIIKVVVAEFKDIPVNEIVPCIGETEISLSVPEQLMVKVRTCANEDIEIDSGKIKLDDVVTVSKNASSMGGSQILLEENEQMTVQDLLKGVAIASGNELAVSIKQSLLSKEEIII